MLVLAAQCYLDLGNIAEARRAVEQLTWSVAKADQDFPARTTAAQLELSVAAREAKP